MYPADIGEAAAVERSVGHALESLHQRAPDKCEQRDKRRFDAVLASPDEAAENYSDNPNRQSHALLPAVNVVAAEPLQRALPCGPEHEHGHANEGEEQHASEGNGEFKQLGRGDEVEHGLPRFPVQHVDNRAIENNHGYDHSISCNNAEQYSDYNLNIQKRRYHHGSPHGLHQPCQNAAVDDEQQAGAEGYAVKQHLRLRVVWQGLL